MEDEVVIAQPGDTFESLAIRLNMKVQDLKALNPELMGNVVQGDKIFIKKQQSNKANTKPIDSQIFNLEVPIDGKLMIVQDNFRFEPYDHRTKPTMFNINQILFYSIKQHPFSDIEGDDVSDDISLLDITYNLRGNEKNIVFVGKNQEVQELHSWVYYRKRELPPYTYEEEDKKDYSFKALRPKNRRRGLLWDPYPNRDVSSSTSSDSSDDIMMGI